MTTPSREEAPERVWLNRFMKTWAGDPKYRPTNATEYLRADLANREPSEGDVERVARAIDDAEFGYSIRLTKLVDGVSEYTLTDEDRGEPLVFESNAAASEYVASKRNRARALAAINAWRNP